MNKSVAIIALSALLATPAFAQQHPVGTPEHDKASWPSPSGNPAAQETLETHKDHKGRTVTEDGRPVAQPEGAEADSKDSTRHSSPGGMDDPASDPGELE